MSHSVTLPQQAMSALNDSIFDNTSMDYELPQQQSQQEQQQEQLEQEEIDTQDMGVLFQLIESREWEGVISFCNQVPDSATVGRVYADDVLNLPLHEVVKQPNPSLTVVNLLLQMYPEGIDKRGYHGNLPLHYACSNENISVNVVGRLLEAFPTATRLRNDDDALPIHLACQYLYELDAIMCILQTNPEGVYLRDADGFTALDYAAGTEHKSIIEQMAPILVETAKAATDRKSEETHQRIKGIQEAHAEYLRQLSEREEDAQNEMIQAQIDLQDALSSEKERNIALAERILDKERKLQDLQIRVDQLTALVKDERLNRQLELAKQQKEYKEILEVTINKEDVPSSPSTRSLESSSSPSKSPIRTSQNMDVKLQLQSLVQKYNLQKSQYAEMAKDLTYNSNMVRNLNELLTSKDEHVAELKQEKASLLQENQEQKEANERLQTNLKQTQDELLDARQEVDRVSNLYQEQSDQLTESNRIVRVQESRLASIKSLAQSLSFNIESWALDDQQKEEETEGWGRGHTQRSQSQPHPSQHRDPTPQQQQQHQEEEEEDLQPSPTDESDDTSRFEVFEGMETIQKGKHQRVSPSKLVEDNHSLKTNEDTLKTSETSLSTRPEETPSPGRNHNNNTNSESMRSTSSQRPMSAMRQASA